MMSSAEKPGVSKTSENEVDNAASLKSGPSQGRNRGDDTDKVTLKAFLKFYQVIVEIHIELTSFASSECLMLRHCFFFFRYHCS